MTPAGLANVRNEFKQYKLQIATMNLEGTISGQVSRPAEISSSNAFLPIFGHVELSCLAVPGYGYAKRLESRPLVVANSALAVSASGFRRDPDNIAAYNGYKMGQLTFAYLNPTVAFDLGENLHAGISVGFAWTGLGMSTNIRSVVHSPAQVNALIGALAIWILIFPPILMLAS